MTNRYSFDPTADAIMEMTEALNTWKKYGKSALERFDATIEATKSFLQEWPYASTKINEELGVRSKSLHNYPYTFYFRIIDEELQIIAFAFVNEKQDPDKILSFVKRRIKQIDGDANA